MEVTPQTYLGQIAAFLKVQGGKITLGENSLPTRVSGKSTNVGSLNILLQLVKEAQSNLEGYNTIEKAEVRQWIEYGVVYASQEDSTTNAQQVHKELNSILSTRTYLVAHKLTLADVLLYYILQKVMESLPLLDKEKYINVSRWFDNLQQNPTLRQSNKVIDFNTMYLANIVPARH